MGELSSICLRALKNLTFKNDSCFAVVVSHDFLFIGIFSLNILTVNLTSCHFWQMPLFPWVISSFQQILLVTISYYVEYLLLKLIMWNPLTNNSYKKIILDKKLEDQRHLLKRKQVFFLDKDSDQPSQIKWKWNKMSKFSSEMYATSNIMGIGINRPKIPMQVIPSKIIYRIRGLKYLLLYWSNFFN